MSFEIYDYRTVNRNVLVTPEIRARLYRMEPGQVDGRHSHDLGHEVFLILEGRAAFEIEGETQELGPGQMCIARANQIHQVRNLLPDQPTIMYLSVTPHIQPTHTMRTEAGDRLPPRFSPNHNYHVEQDMTVQLETALDRHLEAVQAVAEAAQTNLKVHQARATQLKQAMAEGNLEVMVEVRNQMWEALYTLHQQLYALDNGWNELAPRIGTSA